MRARKSVFDRAVPSARCRASISSWVRRATWSSRAWLAACSSRARRASSRCSRTRACTRSGRSGLWMKSTAPRARPRDSLAASVRAVTKMTGMARVASSCCRRSHTSKPSMSGIITSSRIRSGALRRASPRPSCPEVANCTCATCAKAAPSTATFSRTSSMTRMTGCGLMVKRGLRGPMMPQPTARAGRPGGHVRRESAAATPPARCPKSLRPRPCPAIQRAPAQPHPGR